MRKCAFIIHPRLREDCDFGRRVGTFLGIGEKLGMKLTPKKPFEWVFSHLKGRCGFTVCSHFDILGRAEGYLIAVLLTAEQMINLKPRYVRKRIIDDAILYAQNKLGVDIVGLGAYTSPLTDNGNAVIKDERIKCRITHGDSLSAASVLPLAQECLRIKNLSFDSCRIAIIGGAGIVGRGTAILLSELNPAGMILTGRTLIKLEKVAAEIRNNGYTGQLETTVDNSTIINADLIIASTSDPKAIIKPEWLKESCVVIDMAQPYNMSNATAFLRPDVLRVDGGYMSIPGVNINFEMGPPQGATFACFTETMLLSLGNDCDHHVGPIDPLFAKIMLKQAKDSGFGIAPLTSFSEKIKIDRQERLINQNIVHIKTAWGDYS